VSWLTVASSDLEVRRLAERGHALEELLASGRRRGGREQGRHDSGRDVPWLRSRVERLATESDVLGALLGGERCESTMGVAQRERGHPLRVQEVEPHRDAAAHGQPDEVRAAGAVMVEDAPEIAGEIVERERPGVIVARAVAPRIQRRRREVSGEHTELIAPVRAVSADTVQEDHERAVTGAIDGQAGRRADQIERHGRTTRSVLAGSKRPVRASDHSTRQAPRVASSQ